MTPPVPTAPPVPPITPPPLNADQLNALGKTTGYTGPVITATGLKDNPTPIDIPKAPTPTAAPDLTGAVTSTNDAFSKQLADRAATTGASANDALTELLKSLGATEGTTQLTDQAYKDNGVDTAQTDLQQTNDQITAEQEALRHKVEAIKKNPEGYFGTGMQQEIDKVTADSLSKQADLAVIQLSKQGKFDSAKAIADRAVAAKSEAQKTKNDTLQFLYQQMKGDFTTAEQQQFETAQADRVRSAQVADSKELARYTELIKQNDPQYQAELAKTRAETAALGAPSGTLNGKPQTVPQATAQGYADRMAQAEQSIAKLGSQFTGSFAIGDYLPNQLQSGDRQVYEQAKRNFVNAVLRQESGAAISPSEFDSATKQYFPAAGDSPQVIATKAQNRNTAINNFYREANVSRPVNPGDIITDAAGKQYKVGDDGQTITPL